MRAVFAGYPYLLLSMVLAAMAVGLVALLPRSRTRAVYSGLMSMPSSLLSFAFVPEYWRPSRLVDFELGAEDLVFSFATGVIVWVIAEEGCGGRFVFDRLRVSGMLRHLTCAGIFMAVFLPVWWLGGGPMDATLAGGATVGLRLLWPCRRLWRLALTAGVGFSLLYFLVLKAVSVTDPEFFLVSWNLDALWGWQLVGIPAEEMAWAAAFGALWPLTVAYAFGARQEGSVPQRR
jgi:hypothetical protein